MATDGVYSKYHLRRCHAECTAQLNLAYTIIIIHIQPWHNGALNSDRGLASIDEINKATIAYEWRLALDIVALTNHTMRAREMYVCHHYPGQLLCIYNEMSCCTFQESRLVREQC